MNWMQFILLALLAAPQNLEFPAEGELDPLLLETPTTQIVVLRAGLEKAWLEITHLASDLPAELVLLDQDQSSDELFTHTPDLPPGPTMLCSGARGFGVYCEEIYRGADEYVGWPDIEVHFEPGVELRGHYRQDLDPVVGAQVALVPAEFAAFRPYTLPLALREGQLIREIHTDESGEFRIPEIAPGNYFLETVLPTGRVHRADPFTVPEREVLAQQRILDNVTPYPETITEIDITDTPKVEESFFVDLGQIEVPSGLDIELRVYDLAGEPIADASVSANQGSTPLDLVSFESSSDLEGLAILHGLDVERPVRLRCEKEGYQAVVREYELLPVTVDCVMRSWGIVTGEVIDVGGVSPVGAMITIQALSLDPDTTDPNVANRPTDDEPVSLEPEFHRVAYGLFALEQLAAGEYELRAAAPGYRVEKRSFHINFGQELDLGTLLLLFANEFDGLVIDAETGAPIVGVDINSVSPAGAVDTYSDLDGEFRFALADEDPLVLKFSTFDYATREIHLSAAEFTFGEPLVVEMTPAGWILAEVEDESGQRCQGCRVVIWPGGEELWTDSLGEALSGPLEAGNYRVSRPLVTHLGSTVIEQPGAEMFRARVRAGKLTVVRLASEGRELEIRFEGDLDGLWMLSAESRRRTEKTFANEDGEFTIHQQNGEKLDLFLHTFDDELQQETAVWQGRLPELLLSDRISIRLSGSVVQGHAVNAEGPLAGTQVRLLNFADATLRAVSYVHADGSFRIPQVRPGVYNLYIGARSVKFVSVGDRQNVDLGVFELFLP